MSDFRGKILSRVRSAPRPFRKKEAFGIKPGMITTVCISENQRVLARNVKEYPLLMDIAPVPGYSLSVLQCQCYEDNQQCSDE
jgi:hypothetical protein